MAGLSPYKGLEVLSSSPIPGEGGRAINDNFVKLVDWDPKSNWSATTYPTPDDDSSEDYQVGSKWYSPDLGLFICLDATAGAAIWQGINVGQIGLNVSAETVGAGRADLVLPDSTMIGVPASTTWAFSVTTIARLASTPSESACWVTTGVISRDSSTASLVGTNATSSWTNFAGTKPGLEISAFSNSLRVRGEGIASKTINWMANVRIVSLTI